MKKIDLKYTGIPNICFSLTDKDDDREKKFSKQRIKRGFDDSETWSLYTTISKFILPRLKRFKEINIAYPGNLTSEEWDNTLDKIIKAFEYLSSEKYWDDLWSRNDDTHKMIEKGLKLFAKYFEALWW